MLQVQVYGSEKEYDWAAALFLTCLFIAAADLSCLQTAQLLVQHDVLFAPGAMCLLPLSHHYHEDIIFCYCFVGLCPGMGLYLRKKNCRLLLFHDCYEVIRVEHLEQTQNLQREWYLTSRTSKLFEVTVRIYLFVSKLISVDRVLDRESNAMFCIDCSARCGVQLSENTSPCCSHITFSAFRDPRVDSGKDYLLLVRSGMELRN